MEIFQQFISDNWLIGASSTLASLLLTGVALKFLPQRIIDFFLFKRMEMTKHQLEMLLKRKIIWHEKENEVLAQMWEKLAVTKHYSDKSYTYFSNNEELKKRHANFSKDEWKSTVEAILAEIDFLENGDSRFKDMINKFYKERDFIQIANCYLMQAIITEIEFVKYFDANSIFLKPHIKEKFLELRKHIEGFSALQHLSYTITEGKLKIEIKGEPADVKTIKKFKEEIESLTIEVEKTIQKELFPNEKVDSAE